MPELLLVGGGHAHVQVIRQHAMRPFPARVTLIVDDPVAVYSGMVPGLVSGQYAAHELEIDVHALARRAGCRVVLARALRVDADRREIALDGRPPLPFDVASLNIGSGVAGADVPGVREYALASRPIARLVSELEARVERLSTAPEIAVVGAGAGGVELAFCLDARLRAAGRSPRVTLVFSGERPLPDRHPRVAGRIVAAAARRGIALRPGAHVASVGPDALVLADGSPLAAELTVWVAGAAALPLGIDSGLPVDARGFVRVDDTLRVADGLFAVGDCAVPASWPEIPKAGVYAVREGPVLADNLRAALEGRPLRAYRPQSDYFGILNLGDGTAIGAKWGVPIEGARVMAWKDRIDRAFMRRFQVLAPDGAAAPTFDLPAMDAPMRCGGCAAKVGQDPLQRALARLPVADDPRVALGPREADDVVAWREHGALVVQNLDAFPAFTDDPWLVGRAAAVNALSDLYAKGVPPGFATALVTVPEHAHRDALFQVMSGIRAALDPAGVALLGGHTLVGPELVVGLAVTAIARVEPRPLGGARPGDALVLTRALGTGALLHADRAGRASGRDVRRALDAMLVGNGPAADALARVPIRGITDVTGFGLAGHLAELLRASGMSARVQIGAIPALPGVLGLLARGERSTFHDQNRAILAHVAAPAETTRDARFELLFDPQTCGPLLFATPDPDVARAALPGCAVIGVITPPRSDGARFEVVP